MSNEWVMVPREPTRDMIDAAQNAPGNASYLYHARVYRAMLYAAPAAPAGHDFIAHEYRKGFIDGQISMREQLSPAAPQQAEPVAQIGWSDEFGNLFPMAAWKPAQRTHHDAHKTAWRPVFLHPPAAEVTPIGPREPDMAMVICPTCTSQFRAIPVEVQSEVQRLRDALVDAIVEVESWGNYAPDYFQTKHNLAGTLDRLRRALEGE